MKILSTCFLSLALTLSLEALADGNVAIKGDFRFRTENIKEEQATPLPEGDRTRQRIRARMTITGKVNEKTEAVVRLATGSTSTVETTTTNQDLTDYYAKKAIVLDMAYFNWKSSDSVTIWGGKSPIPFTLVGGNDLIFDSDITPEGLSLKYVQPLNGGYDFLVNTAATWLNERYSATGATDNTDVGLVGAQLGFNYKTESWNAALTAASYNFSNIKGSTAAAAKGNTLVGGAYTQEYKLTSIGLEFGTKVSDMPLSVFAESVSNSEGGNYKAGSIYGVKLGKLKDKDSWMVSVDSRELEKDAAVGVLTESDSAGGGTDIRSVRLTGGYQVADNANISLTYMTGKKAISSTVLSPNYNRAQFDFNFNF